MKKTQEKLDEILQQNLKTQIISNTKDFSAFLSENIKYLLDENHWYFSLYMKLKYFFYENLLIKRKDYLCEMKSKDNSPEAEKKYEKIKEFIQELIEISRKEKARYLVAQEKVNFYKI